MHIFQQKPLNERKLKVPGDSHIFIHILFFVCFWISEDNSEEMYEDIYKAKNNDQKPEWVSFLDLDCRLMVFPVYLVSQGLSHSPISHHCPWGKITLSDDNLLKYYIVTGNIFISAYNNTS